MMLSCIIYIYRIVVVLRCENTYPGKHAPAICGQDLVNLLSCVLQNAESANALDLIYIYMFNNNGNILYGINVPWIWIDCRLKERERCVQGFLDSFVALFVVNVWMEIWLNQYIRRIGWQIIGKKWHWLLRLLIINEISFNRLYIIKHCFNKIKINGTLDNCYCFNCCFNEVINVLKGKW